LLWPFPLRQTKTGGLDPDQSLAVAVKNILLPKWVFFVDVTKNHLTSTVINPTSIIFFGEWMYFSIFIDTQMGQRCDVGFPAQQASVSMS
jgi:hypothetical protein